MAAKIISKSAGFDMAVAKLFIRASGSAVYASGIEAEAAT
jgi:hypothetical protein